jgi:NAD-dependent deacetylase
LNRDNNLIEKVVQLLKQSHSTIALTGAGISVESGIPDFRSPGGLWTKLDPMEYLSISGFRKNPEKTWELLFYFDDLISKAKPNNAHLALVRLEELGVLDAVITQNIDFLHQQAGSDNVIEFHGNGTTLTCIDCGAKYKRSDFSSDLQNKTIPKCIKCGFPLKPDVTFFEEPVPVQAIRKAFDYASRCDLLILIGTSAVVSPANQIPYIAKQYNSIIVEINKTETLVSSMCDFKLRGNASVILDSIVKQLEKYES